MSHSIIDQSQLAIIFGLGIGILFLSVLLAFGIRKFFALKKENDAVKKTDTSSRVDNDDFF